MVFTTFNMFEGILLTLVGILKEEYILVMIIRTPGLG